MGRFLVAVGFLIMLVGMMMTLGSKLGIGRLPGDITVHKSNFTFYFPIATSIIISVVLTILVNMISKWRR